MVVIRMRVPSFFRCVFFGELSLWRWVDLSINKNLGTLWCVFRRVGQSFSLHSLQGAIHFSFLFSLNSRHLGMCSFQRSKLSRCFYGKAGFLRGNKKTKRGKGAKIWLTLLQEIWRKLIEICRIRQRPKHHFFPISTQVIRRSPKKHPFRLALLWKVLFWQYSQHLDSYK